MSKRIAIMMHGQAGDQMSALSVLRYKHELWGDAKIVWFSSMENYDIFKGLDIEVREFPRGFGYPEMVAVENAKLIALGKDPVWEDWKPLVDENNHMNLELKNNYPSLAEFDLGFFPAPHQVPMERRNGLEYANVSKKIFGVLDSYEWHPCLSFTDEEINEVDYFIHGLPQRKTVAIESFGGSSQSAMSDIMIRRTLKICRDILGECNFIFLSHKYLREQEVFPDDILREPDVYTAAHFTVRQCALVVNRCDLLISVSSGISVASSCWKNREKPVPILQFCGSEVCSTKALTLGRFELVTSAGKSTGTASDEYYLELMKLLTEIL